MSAPGLEPGTGGLREPDETAELKPLGGALVAYVVLFVAHPFLFGVALR